MTDVSVVESERLAHVRERFVRVGTAQLADAAAEVIEVLDLPLLPRTTATHICGPLFPVETDDDMLPCLQALAAVPRGWVLFITNKASKSEGLVGDIFCFAAEKQELAGVVVNGAARDLGELGPTEIPVFSTEVNCVSARTTTKRAESVPSSVQVGGLTISPGVWLFGDHDGFLLVSPEHVDPVLVASEVLRERELRLKAELESGRRLDEIIGLEDFVAGVSESLRFAP